MVRAASIAIAAAAAAAAAACVAGCGPAADITGELRVANTMNVEDAGPPRPPRARPDAGIPGANCPEPTLTAIREKTFIPHCSTADCHAQPTPALGLDLTAPVEELAARLMEPAMQSVSGLALVKPGQFGASWLYLKVFLETPGEGTQMPPATHLDECAVIALREWIQAGAPN